MNKRLFAVLLAALVTVGLNPTSRTTTASAGDLSTLNPASQLAIMAALGEPVMDPVDDPPSQFRKVRPFIYDPKHTRLIQSTWLDGIGCPTSATWYGPNSDFSGPSNTPMNYKDLGCPTGDPKDTHFEGLLLAKTGPTANFASAGAELTNVRGLHLTELGWDVRKSATEGSHCSGGAPRFNVSTDVGFHFVGSCPSGVITNLSEGWQRYRFTPAQAFPPIAPTETVQRIQIIFDEGQDLGPASFGLAILDNIDVNGTLVGRGSPGPGMSESNDDDDD